MKREALVPIDDEILALIGEQKQRALQRFPDGTPVLFPRQNRNLSGRRSLPSHTYRSALYRWLEDCDIRDEHGQPVRLTPINGGTPWERFQPGRPPACRAEDPRSNTTRRS
jgi:hypothetical protein